MDRTAFYPNYAGIVVAFDLASGDQQRRTSKGREAYCNEKATVIDTSLSRAHLDLNRPLKIEMII